MNDEKFAEVIEEAKQRYAPEHPMQKKLLELEDAYEAGKKFQAEKKAKKKQSLLDKIKKPKKKS